MSGEPVFSQQVLVGWIAAAVIVFAISLYFIGGGQLSAPPVVDPSTFSRSAIGHAGIAEVLQRLNIPVVKNQDNSLDKLAARRRVGACRAAPAAANPNKQSARF